MRLQSMRKVFEETYGSRSKTDSIGVERDMNHTQNHLKLTVPGVGEVSGAEPYQCSFENTGSSRTLDIRITLTSRNGAESTIVVPFEALQFMVESFSPMADSIPLDLD